MDFKILLFISIVYFLGFVESTENGENRIGKQINPLDPIRCLPRVLCGMNMKSGDSRPPSKDTSLMNDLVYLTKILNDDKENGKNKTVTPKSRVTSSKQITSGEEEEEEDDEENTSSQEDGGSSPESQEHENEGFRSQIPEQKRRKSSDDEEFDRLALLEEKKMEELAEEEMIDEDPAMFKYVLQDLTDKMKKQLPHKSKNKKNKLRGGQHEESQQEDSYEHHPQYFGPSGPNPLTQPRNPYLADYDDGPQLSYSLFGFGNSDKKVNFFKNDPFFSDLGFRKRRSVDLDKNKRSKNLIKGRKERALYLEEKKREVLEARNDPYKQLQIARDVIEKVQSPRQCRALFGRCPYQANELTDMVSAMSQFLDKKPSKEFVNDAIEEAEDAKDDQEDDGSFEAEEIQNDEKEFDQKPMVLKSTKYPNQPKIISKAPYQVYPKGSPGRIRYKTKPTYNSHLKNFDEGNFHPFLSQNDEYPVTLNDPIISNLGGNEVYGGEALVATATTKKPKYKEKPTTTETTTKPEKNVEESGENNSSSSEEQDENDDEENSFENNEEFYYRDQGPSPGHQFRPIYNLNRPQVQHKQTMGGPWIKKHHHSKVSSQEQVDQQEFKKTEKNPENKRPSFPSHLHRGPPTSFQKSKLVQNGLIKPKPAGSLIENPSDEKQQSTFAAFGNLMKTHLIKLH